MKQTTKILGTATVVGLLSVPIAFAADWQTPFMWDWVIHIAAPKLNQHDAEIVALQAEVDALTAKLAYLEVDDTTDPLKPVVRIVGANLQVVNGLGSTRTVNGVGNIIVGYDEGMSFLCFSIPAMEDYYDGTACGNAGGFWIPQSAIKIGSHNVVVGDRHTYSSYSGVVTGTASRIEASGATVTGGVYNTADGAFSSLSGGVLNSASARRSSVSGGSVNHVDPLGIGASISGGAAATINDPDDWQAGTLFEDN